MAAVAKVCQTLNPKPRTPDFHATVLCFPDDFLYPMYVPCTHLMFVRVPVRVRVAVCK